MRLVVCGATGGTCRAVVHRALAVGHEAIGRSRAATDVYSLGAATIVEAARNRRGTPWPILPGHELPNSCRI